MKRGNRMGENNKGFTLIELIAVIAILAVIATLAVISVTTIRGRVNEKEYVNLATTIKTAAQGYAEETGVSKMFVQTLIDKGLVQTDDETKELRDPRDNSSLNCQIINFENGEAVLSDEENPSCDVSLLSDTAIKIQYSLNSDPSKIKRDLPNDYWFNQAITLSVASTGTVNLDLTNAEFKWTSPLAPDMTYTSRDLEINNKYVEDTYQVIVTVGDRKYTAYGKVKIDREAPKAYNFIDTAPEDWSPKKKLQFELSDVGSGLAAYALSKSNTQEPTTWTQVNPKGKKNDKINLTQDLGNLGLQEGDYVYIWVKDQVGNVNRDDLLDSDGAGGGGGAGAGGLRFDNVDAIIDSVTLTGTPNNSTYSREVTLTGSFQDKKSGAVGWYCSTSKTPPAVDSTLWTSIARTTSIYNVTCPGTKTSNGKYYLHVKDYVGNRSYAEYEVKNIDRNIDGVTITDTQSGYRETTRLKATARDNLSKIVGYTFSTSSATPGSYTRVTAQSQIEVYFTADQNIAYYFHVIDAAGNTAKATVTVKNLVYEEWKDVNLYSKTRSSIQKTTTLPRAVKITRSSVDTGSVSTSLSGTTATISTRNGYTYSDYYWDTCPGTTHNYKATSVEVCKGSYSCPNGGKVSDDQCVANHSSPYEISSNPKEYQTYECMANGGWTKISGKNPSTECPDGYSRKGGNDAYGCNGPTKTCKQGETTSVYYGCKTKCYWDGNYAATCSRKGTEYKCGSGHVKVGTTCYWCSGDQYYSSSEGGCIYDCKQYYDYWEYNVRVYYYVLK